MRLRLSQTALAPSACTRTCVTAAPLSPRCVLSLANQRTRRQNVLQDMQCQVALFVPIQLANFTVVAVPGGDGEI